MNTKKIFFSFAQEMQYWYKRYYTVGLLYSVALHIIIIGVIYIVQYMNNEPPIVTIRKIPQSIIDTQPSIKTDTDPQIIVPQLSHAIAKEAIPIPSPDDEVSIDQTIADQNEMNKNRSIIPVSDNDSIVSDIHDPLQDKKSAEEEPRMDTFIPVEKYPEPVNMVKPNYPALAIRAGLECTVIMNALVDKEGRVEKAVVIKDEGLTIFDEPAIVAAKQWVFTPAIMNHHPVKIWITIPMRFRLR